MGGTSLVGSSWWGGWRWWSWEGILERGTWEVAALDVDWNCEL